MSIKEIIEQAITERLTLEIQYQKDDGTKSTREISDITYSAKYGIDCITAFCHLRNDKRTFKISRINAATIVPSKTQDVPEIPEQYSFNRNKKIFNLYGENYEEDVK